MGKLNINNQETNDSDFFFHNIPQTSLNSLHLNQVKIVP